MNTSSECFPICNYHSDCFANREGKCITLTDTNFKRGYCPFYKNEDKLNNQIKRQSQNDKMVFAMAFF